jgi:membrane-associated HD superfamily phosphohydrolase
MTESQLFTIALVGLIVTPLVTLLTTFMVQAFQWTTSAEQRKRDMEDRKEVARQAKLASEEAKKASVEAKKVSQESVAAIKVMHTDVVKVGEQATAAYKEANQSNLKIQAVQDALTTVLNLPQKPITESTGVEPTPKEKE